MVKGALFTFGCLSILGGLGLGLAMIMGAIMSDNPQESNETSSVALWVGGIGVGIGAALIASAFLL